MMDESGICGLVNPEAAWIWVAQPDRRYNQYVCFRRTITVAGSACAARLRLTADARYEVYLNGEWLGHGPPRSWPEPWPVDEYDLDGRLRPGVNVIAVLVTHFGIGTMQYLLEAPGLLAQMDWTDQFGAHRVVTDESWRAQPHPGYLWPAPRVSIPLAWEEQFDARTPLSAGAGWQACDYDDADWPAARVARKAGVAPHATFEPRDIPPLTREAVDPVRLVSTEAVAPAPVVWSLLLRGELGMDDDAAAVAVGRLLVASYIHSPCEQEVEFQDPHQLSPWVAAYWKLNGQRFGSPEPDPSSSAFQDLSWGGTAHDRLTLHPGWNLLLGRINEVQQVFRAVLSLRCRHPVTFHATPELADTQQPPWLVLGPFGGAPGPDSSIGNLHRNAAFAKPTHVEATSQRFELIWQRGSLLPEDLVAPFTRRLSPERVAPIDVFAVCASEQVIDSIKPRVEDPQALLAGDAACCTVHPLPNGDVRLLFDFGRELIGFNELEVDAPEGTIIDVHGFEFIQTDGRFNLAEGMNNTFRYICREGLQRYRTFLRRGFRYCWISLRQFDRAVRIRYVRAIFNTYPFTYQGDFACSDPMLERIWHIGAHTVRCCAEDTYTDCPSYEQVHWVGDARNEAQVDLIVNGDGRLSRHCWLQAARSLERSPLVESQVPSAWQNLLPAWSFLWMRWAREHHMFTGDDAFAREACPWLDRNVRGIEQYLNDRGLFEISAWNMFDWAPMDTPPSGVVTHQNCLAVLGLRDAAAFADAIGESQRAHRWRALAEDLAEAINRDLWDDGRQAYVDCLRNDGTPSTTFSQQTQTAAYIAEVARGERARRCRGIMANPPSGFVTAGSPFFMFFLLEALAREGNIEQMTRLIRDYWGKQVEAGATTFWEMYHADAKRMTRSHCHGWSAAPTVFLTQHVLGVRPMTPGYRQVRISPSCELAWARGRVPTPRGDLHIHWRRKAQRLMLDLDLPPQTEALIEAPPTGEMHVSRGSLERLDSNNGASIFVTRTPCVQLTRALS